MIPVHPSMLRIGTLLRHTHYVLAVLIALILPSAVTARAGDVQVFETTADGGMLVAQQPDIPFGVVSHVDATVTVSPSQRLQPWAIPFRGRQRRPSVGRIEGASHHYRRLAGISIASSLRFRITCAVIACPTSRDTRSFRFGYNRIAPVEAASVDPYTASQTYGT